MKMKKKIWIITITTFVLSSVIRIFIASGTLGKGDELAHLDGRARTVISQNSVLRGEVALGASLQAVSGEAGQLGFSKPKGVVYLSLPEDTLLGSAK